MTTITEHVYTTRDNTIDLELREDGAVVDISAITRVRLELFPKADITQAPIVVDSTITPTAFDWVTQGAAGVLLLKLGGLALGDAEHLARLVLYDVANPLGLLWTHEATSGCAGTQFVISSHTAADAA